MEDLLQEIKKNFPVMEQCKEEFETLKKWFENELKKMFDIEDLETKKNPHVKNPHRLDLSQNDISDNLATSDISGNIIYRDYPVITYFNPFYFLYVKIPNSHSQVWKKKIRFYYRKILLQCHPDKQKQRRRRNLSGLTRQECQYYMQQAKDAYKKDQYGIVLYIASISGIVIHRLSKQELSRLEIEFEEIKRSIATIQNSFPWLWKYQPWTRNQIIEFLKKKHRLIPKS